MMWGPRLGTMARGCRRGGLIDNVREHTRDGKKSSYTRVHLRRRRECGVRAEKKRNMADPTTWGGNASSSSSSLSELYNNIRVYIMHIRMCVCVQIHVCACFLHEIHRVTLFFRSTFAFFRLVF